MGLKRFDKTLLIFVVILTVVLMLSCMFAYAFLDNITIGGLKLGGMILLLYHLILAVLSLLLLLSSYKMEDE